MCGYNKIMAHVLWKWNKWKSNQLYKQAEAAAISHLAFKKQRPTNAGVP